MTSTLNQIIFFPPPKSEYFFQQHWESEYFFRKKTYPPPPPLQVIWSVPKEITFYGYRSFKVIDKQTPVYLHDLVTIKKSSYSFRYNNTVNIPRVNTTRYGLHSLRYGAAKLWNELPSDLREGISLNNLKNLISKWDGNGCSCSF